MSNDVYREPCLLLLLAACPVYFNIEEYFPFSGHRNNMNLCLGQMRCDSSFEIRWKTVSPLSGQSHRRKGRREQGPWEAVGKNSFELSSNSEFQVGNSRAPTFPPEDHWRRNLTWLTIRCRSHQSSASQVLNQLIYFVIIAWVLKYNMVRLTILTGQSYSQYAVLMY
jgi:hypothetical protein